MKVIVWGDDQSAHVQIMLSDNQRLRLDIDERHENRMRKGLRVRWERRVSDKHVWDGPNAESRTLGYGTLDLSGFELLP